MECSVCRIGVVGKGICEEYDVFESLICCKELPLLCGGVTLDWMSRAHCNTYIRQSHINTYINWERQRRAVESVFPKNRDSVEPLRELYRRGQSVKLLEIVR